MVAAAKRGQPHLSCARSRDHCRDCKGHVPAESCIDWDRWEGDYSLIRDAIELPIRGRRAPMCACGGSGDFYSVAAACERKWKTKTVRPFIALKASRQHRCRTASNQPRAPVRPFELRPTNNDRLLIATVCGILSAARERPAIDESYDIDRLGIAERRQGKLATDVAAAKDGVDRLKSTA